MTWMTHPRHGRTYAVGAEIEWNEKNGWKIEEPNPKAKPVDPKVAEDRSTLSLKTAPKS